MKLSKTPAPKSERIYGSELNKPKSAESSSKASSIVLGESTINSIKSILDKHNDTHTKKIPLSVGKAVVRRGMGAYSSTHRPTISDGKPNSRVAWGLARLNAFVYKIQKGHSKSGKYIQDDDLINEMGIMVKKYKNGGNVDEEFDYMSLFSPSPEEKEKINQEIKKSKEKEKEDWYQRTKFSKKWAATYQDAVNKTVKEYLDAKATYEGWGSRQYKQNKGMVFLGGDDIFGEAKSIGSINEGRRQRVLRGAKMQMDEAIETLKELRLTDEEISNLLNNKMKQGGTINNTFEYTIGGL